MNRLLEIAAMRKQAALQEIRNCNSYSGQFGLTLMESEIQELNECRERALKGTGRVEFGGGVLPKLIHAFCDSPYLDQNNYASALSELQEAFYYFKGEAHEQFTDDELIGFMAEVFNGRAQGSAEYLIGTSLESLCRYANNPFDAYDADEAGDLF